MGENLVEALQRANNESRQHVADLDRTARLMGHESADADPGLRLSKVATGHLIHVTERAIASGDVIEMLKAAKLHGIGESHG